MGHPHEQKVEALFLPPLPDSGGSPATGIIFALAATYSGVSGYILIRDWTIPCNSDTAPQVS